MVKEPRSKEGVEGPMDAFRSKERGVIQYESILGNNEEEGQRAKSK